MADKATRREDRRALQVSPEVLALFNSACESDPIGRSKFDVLNRLLRWFVRQPPLVQTAILQDIDAGIEEAYAVALRRLASEIEPSRKFSSIVGVDDLEFGAAPPIKHAPAEQGEPGIGGKDSKHKGR